MKSSFSVDDVRLGEVTLRQQAKRNLVIFFKKSSTLMTFFFGIVKHKTPQYSREGFSTA